MATVHGMSPGEKAPVPRDLDIWMKNGRLHLWIHKPGSSENDGWEVHVAPEALLDALGQLPELQQNRAMRQ
jgi:hypothetical protein